MTDPVWWCLDPVPLPWTNPHEKSFEMTLPNERPDDGTEGRDEPDAVRPGGVLLHGYLRKLKVTVALSSFSFTRYRWPVFCRFLRQRLKKKFFILYSNSESAASRLDYYDSEKKWRNGQSPKRFAPSRYCCCPHDITNQRLPLSVSDPYAWRTASTSTGATTASTSTWWPCTRRKTVSPSPSIPNPSCGNGTTCCSGSSSEIRSTKERNSNPSTVPLAASLTGF